MSYDKCPDLGPPMYSPYVVFYINAPHIQEMPLYYRLSGFFTVVQVLCYSELRIPYVLPIYYTYYQYIFYHVCPVRHVTWLVLLQQIEAVINQCFTMTWPSWKDMVIPAHRGASTTGSAIPTPCARRLRYGLATRINEQVRRRFFVMYCTNVN